MINILRYYFLTTYRRKSLDRSLNESRKYLTGKVLDIGGGKKDGNFSTKNKTWVIVDVDKKSKPNVVASVEKLPFKNNSFDSVKATELFEHVENFDAAIKECSRVLMKNGHMVISVPFLFPIHPDPNDYQRFTAQKWKEIFKKNNLKIIKLEDQGYFFTVICEYLRLFVTNIKLAVIRYPLYLIYPLLDLLVKLDNTNLVRNSQSLNKFVIGYFIVVKK